MFPLVIRHFLTRHLINEMPERYTIIERVHAKPCNLLITVLSQLGVKRFDCITGIYCIIKSGQGAKMGQRPTGMVVFGIQAVAKAHA